MSLFDRVEQASTGNYANQSTSTGADLSGELEYHEGEIALGKENLEVADIALTQADRGLANLEGYLNVVLSIGGESLDATSAILLGLGIESNNQLSFLNLDVSDTETVFGKESFSSPSQCADSTALGTESLASKIKAGAKKVWEKIVEFFKRIKAYFTQLVGGSKAQIDRAKAITKKAGELGDKVVKEDAKIKIPQSLVYKGKIDAESVVKGFSHTKTTVESIIEKAGNDAKTMITELDVVKSKVLSDSEMEAVLAKVKGDSGAAGVELSGGKVTAIEDDILYYKAPEKEKDGDMKTAPLSKEEILTTAKEATQAFISINAKKAFDAQLTAALNAAEAMAKFDAKTHSEGDEKAAALIEKNAKKLVMKIQKLTSRTISASFSELYSVSKAACGVAEASLALYVEKKKEDKKED